MMLIPDNEQALYAKHHGHFPSHVIFAPYLHICVQVDSVAIQHSEEELPANTIKYKTLSPPLQRLVLSELSSKLKLTHVRYTSMTTTFRPVSTLDLIAFSLILKAVEVKRRMANGESHFIREMKNQMLTATTTQIPEHVQLNPALH
jgi:hypothetical protein